jgi:hypothetical protein
MKNRKKEERKKEERKERKKKGRKEEKKRRKKEKEKEKKKEEKKNDGSRGQDRNLASDWEHAIPPQRSLSQPVLGEGLAPSANVCSHLWGTRDSQQACRERTRKNEGR